MIVGHALLGVALGILGARWCGADPQRALRIGGVTGGFALVPDVDIAFAILGIGPALGGMGAVDAFWDAGLAVHRDVTHSLLLAPVAAAAFAGAWTVRRRVRATSIGAMGLLVVGSGVIGRSAGAAIAAGLYVLAGMAVARVAQRRAIGHRAVFGAALVALLSHPFGDLFTGTPPHLLYPLPVRVVTEYVRLSPDPTLHLYGTFALELVAAWAAVVAYTRIRTIRLSSLVRPWAVLGVGYAPVAARLPAPTLNHPYRFTAAILGVTALVVAATILAERWREARRGGFQRGAPEAVTALRPLVTGLAGLTLALAAATAIHLF